MAIKAQYLGLTTVTTDSGKKFQKFSVELKDADNHKMTFYFETFIMAGIYEKWVNSQKFPVLLKTCESKLKAVMIALKTLNKYYPEILSVDRRIFQQLREVKI